MTQFDWTFDGAISWETEPVQKQYGPNGSDRRVCNPAAQIPVMQDVDAFRKAFGDDIILSMSDGTSLRVEAQRIARKDEFAGGKNPDENRQAVVDWMKGIRRKASRPAPRRALPDGTFYTGTDETEYRQKYTAALVDAGVDSTLALGIARALPW